MRKPLTGAILGFIFGLAIAVILQQQGVWPLDQITVFLVPAITGVIGMLLLSVGREGSTFTYVVAILLMIPALVWGAIGLGTTNEVGQLNGGCQVHAETSVPDSTDVTNSSKRAPFQIDPQGSFAWAGASPVAFMDYDWSLYTDVGGIQVPLDSGHEANEGGSQVNGGEVPNIEAYAESKGVDISSLRGVFKVGGEAADTCAGFGFVVLIADGLTLPSIIAGIIALLILIILIVLTIVGRGGKVSADASTIVAEEGGRTIGAHEAGARDGTAGDKGDEFIEDLGYAAGESDLGPEDGVKR